MSLSIGIVGLPNVGKSTLFNALVKGHQANVSNYPFTTIDKNIGIVEVPDAKLERLAKELKLPKKIPATVKFIDIAGLVKNAHKGEGLGNQFLAHIREVDAIIHILRSFEDKNITHISGKIEPKEDKKIVEFELELAEIKKPTLNVINCSEDQLKNPPKIGDAIYFCAKTELELLELTEEEQKQYLAQLGQKESGLVRIIKEAYKLLDLITFYTLLADQIQAWPIRVGTKAPEAAGKVHSDMQRGFIAAEVVGSDELLKLGGWDKAREAGKIRTEGKDYQIKDGDVVKFKFAT